MSGARQVIGYSRENRVGVYRAIAELRTKGVRTSIGSVRTYFGNAVEIDWRGKLVATASDPNLRVMNVMTPAGEREVYVRGSRQASFIGAHEAAVKSALLGDESRIDAWRARHGDLVLQGTDGRMYALETDAEAIEERDRMGEISYEDIYPEVE